MTAAPDRELPQLFRCAEDLDGSVVLGHHDGISSWTLNTAADPSGTQQAYVSHHERAHHRLHAGAPWGTAMLATGLADEEGRVAASLWQALALGCTQTHEAYATFAAVATVSDGLDALQGNLGYLQHYRNASAIARVFEEGVADAAFQLLMHLLMSPPALLSLAPAELRSDEAIERLVREHAPDLRFARLRQALRDEAVRKQLQQLVPSGPAPVLDPEAFSIALDRAGIDTATPDAVNEWTSIVIAGLQGVHPSLILDDSGAGDRLASLLDDQQRERLQIHHDRLTLQQVVPASNGSFPTRRFVRTATDLGPHVWAAWLHPAFLRRQFLVEDDTFGDECTLGLLSCDRTHGAPYAAWLPWPDVPPGPAIAAIRRRGQSIEPLLFTTWRTLDLTADGVDFRGFEPAFVLIDSDVLAFLSRTVDQGALATWAVVGTSGDRTVDVLALESDAIRGVISVLVCSAPTGRLVANWLRAHQAHFRQDSSAFQTYRAHLWALCRHLLGTFWIFDLHGW